MLEQFKKFRRVSKFSLSRFDEDQTTDGTPMLILTLEEPFTATGKRKLLNGKDNTVTSTEMTIVGQEDIDAFYEGSSEVEGVMMYEGNMKVDVAPPKFDLEGVLTVSPKLYLTLITFDKRAAQGRANYQQLQINALDALEALNAEKAAAEAAAAAAAAKSATPEVKTEVKPEVKAPINVSGQMKEQPVK